MSSLDPDTCGNQHPQSLAMCELTAEHTGLHRSSSSRPRRVWSQEEPLDLDYKARTSDPESSHRAAERKFDSGSLAGEILKLDPTRWMTCREIIKKIFGWGPYTYDEAVKLNKVQTVALKLHRLGYLERRDLDGSEIEYRRSMG